MDSGLGKVSGTVVVRDKDGNIKQQVPFEGAVKEESSDGNHARDSDPKRDR